MAESRGVQARVLGSEPLPAVSAGEGSIRVRGWGWPVVVIMHWGTWARASREGQENKGKWQALPSPSSRPSKRVHLLLKMPSPSFPLHLSPVVFSPLLGQLLCVDVGVLQECLAQSK